jgi:hypothetical protein
MRPLGNCARSQLLIRNFFRGGVARTFSPHDLQVCW